MQPIPLTGQDWMRQTEKRIGFLERRPGVNGSIEYVNNASDLAALVAARSPSPGRPLVVIRGDLPGTPLTATSDGVMWTETKPSPAPYMEPTLSSPWTNFITVGHHRASSMRTATGIVALAGLVNGGSVGSTIFTLPPDQRPDVRLPFPVLTGGGFGRIDVNTNGTVVLTTGSGYVSLEGIMFPAAGVLTFTTVTTFQGLWASYHTIDATYPPFGYAIDPLGRVWWQGLARQTTPSTLGGDSPICTVPFRKNLQSHYPGLGTNAFASLHIVDNGTGSTLAAKAGTVTNYVSVQRAVFPHSTIADGWYQIDPYLNTWSRFSTSFPASRFLPFADGIVLADGLIMGGTVSGAATGVSQCLIEGFLPDVAYGRNRFRSGKQVYLANASNALARSDYASNMGDSTAPLPPVVWEASGSNVWRSHGGMNYIIGG